MRVALVGNNDGPLILANSMQANSMRAVCIGLQKPVPELLKAGYFGMVGEENYFSGFDEARLLKALEAFEFDILINCFCNFKFKRLLDRYTILNVHLAPLPKYRGRHPLHSALINGEAEFGFSVHKMDADFDAGDIYWQEMVPVKNGMSVEELREALMKRLASGFGNFMEKYANGSVTPRKNENGRATYAPKRHPEDSRLTEWNDRDLMYRKVMALRSGNHPAYLEVAGTKIVVTRAELEDENGVTSFREKKRSREQSGEQPAKVERLYADGISILCPDGKQIGLYGFDPKEFQITEKQELT